MAVLMTISSSEDDDADEIKTWLRPPECVLKTPRVCWPDWVPEAQVRLSPSGLQTEHLLRDGRG